MERSEHIVRDRQLLEDFVLTGRDDCFDLLVQRYKVSLFNVAYRVLYDRHAAEDVVQGVFIRVLKRRAELTEMESLRPWLYRTALNLSLNMKRDMGRRRQREKIADMSPSPETPRDAVARAEQGEELELALKNLKDSLRIPLMLRYLQGLSQAETGKIMSLSGDAIRMRIGRGLKKLRRLLRRRGLLISMVAVEEGLRSLPAKAVSANFLTSASSLIEAASTAGIAAKAAVTTTTVIKGGLMTTAKSKIAVGVGAAILAGGTVTYLATRGPDREPPGPPVESDGTRARQEPAHGCVLPSVPESMRPSGITRGCSDRWLMQKETRCQG